MNDKVWGSQRDGEGAYTRNCQWRDPWRLFGHPSPSNTNCPVRPKIGAGHHLPLHLTLEPPRPVLCERHDRHGGETQP